MPPSWTSEFTAIPLERVVAAFQPTVRMLLDWELVRRANAGTHLALAQDREYADWYVPWFRSPVGTEIQFDHPMASPMRVRDAAAPDWLNWGRRRHVESLAAAFRKAVTPLQLVALVYTIPGGRSFVLDGNHRLVAAEIANCKAFVWTFVIEGPCDPAILPDLRHWCPGNAAKPPLPS